MGSRRPSMSPESGQFTNMHIFMFNINYRKSNTKCSIYCRGALLLELLLAISILAIILSVASQSVLVSLNSEKFSGERDVAVALASEALEAVRGVADEKWANMYGLTGKGATHYRTVQSGNKWILEAGDETVALNSASYTRYVIIDNVSRDSSANRLIESTYNATNDDPSTQKATVTVSWTGGSPIVISEYFFRWRNKVCDQTGWVGNGGSGDAVVSCGTTTYNTIDSAISTSTGTLKLQ